MTSLFMLDTNAVSAVMHGRNPALDRRVTRSQVGLLCISCVTYGETKFGLALRPGASRLISAADHLFGRIAILPWTRETADGYAWLRAEMRRIGKALAPLDMLIAAHAVEAGATLVTSDRAFLHVPGLSVEDWTAP